MNCPSGEKQNIEFAISSAKLMRCGPAGVEGRGAQRGARRRGVNEGGGGKAATLVSGAQRSMRGHTTYSPR